MSGLRPVDLAREHGISTQAVRNYQHAGCLPPTERTASGYRVYTRVHATALRTYLALVRGYGHAAGGQIMRAVHGGDIGEALAVIDAGHEQMHRDRKTLDAARRAVEHLTANAPADPRRTRAGPRVLTIGDLAHRLGLDPATLRVWERNGILVPRRDPSTGYRVYGEDDVRDAELAHLLRRGGRLLDQIAMVIQQIRTAGGTEELSRTLDDWRCRHTEQGIAMLDAAGSLNAYLAVLARPIPARTRRSERRSTASFRPPSEMSAGVASIVSSAGGAP